MKKKINTILLKDNTEVHFFDLPTGYFYKNHFYTETKMFSVLVKEKVITVNRFANGTWRFNDFLFTSLEELYEYFEDYFDKLNVSYNLLKRNWSDFDIRHSSTPITLYSYEDDYYNQLYEKEEILTEIRNETNLIEREEEREEEYLNKITDDECRVYLKKPIKERIKILEEYKQ